MSTSATPSLSNKVALVTGGTSGIGLATAQLLQQHGANVIVTGSSDASTAAARVALGDRALVLRADARSATDAAVVAGEIKKRFGKLDVVFLNAGVGDMQPLGTVTEQHIDNLLDVNVKGPILQLHAVHDLLKDGASIVVNTSVVSVKGIPTMSVYSATKGALSAWVRSLAVELAPRKIRVNAVAPGPIDTPILSRGGKSAEQVQATKDFLVSGVPLGQLGASQDIAEAVLYLSTARFVTGAELIVDGGMSA